MLNHITLIGRITKNPELRSTMDGKKFVGFTLAVNDNFNNKTDFISCYVWNKPAETLAKYIRKGSLLAVEGKLSTMKKDQQVNTITFVTVNRVTFLEKKDKESNQNDFNFDSNSNDINNNDNRDNDSNNSNDNNSSDFKNQSVVNKTIQNKSNNDNLFDEDDYDIKWE